MLRHLNIKPHSRVGNPNSTHLKSLQSTESQNAQHRPSSDSTEEKATKHESMQSDSIGEVPKQSIGMQVRTGNSARLQRACIPDLS